MEELGFKRESSGIYSRAPSSTPPGFCLRGLLSMQYAGSGQAGGTKKSPTCGSRFLLLTTCWQRFVPETNWLFLKPISIQDFLPFPATLGLPRASCLAILEMLKILFVLWKGQFQFVGTFFWRTNMQMIHIPKYRHLYYTHVYSSDALYISKHILSFPTPLLFLFLQTQSWCTIVPCLLGPPPMSTQVDFLSSEQVYWEPPLSQRAWNPI